MCSIYSALAAELLRSCTKPSLYLLSKEQDALGCMMNTIEKSRILGAMWLKYLFLESPLQFDTSCFTVNRVHGDTSYINTIKKVVHFQSALC